MPDRIIAKIADWFFRELLVRCLQLLEADDVGLGIGKPTEENGQPAVDTIDVVGGDLHEEEKSAAADSFRGLSVELHPQWLPIAAG